MAAWSLVSHGQYFPHGWGCMSAICEWYINLLCKNVLPQISLIPDYLLVWMVKQPDHLHSSFNLLQRHPYLGPSHRWLFSILISRWVQVRFPSVNYVTSRAKEVYWGITLTSFWWKIFKVIICFLCSEMYQNNKWISKNSLMCPVPEI